jgi:hypothetical protein
MNEHRAIKHAAELVRGLTFMEYRRDRRFFVESLAADESQHLGRELTADEKDAIQAILSYAALEARS